jgi:multidrug resistance efflux pump
VKGQVKAARAEANQPVKECDLLLKIDPAPYSMRSINWRRSSR